MFVDDVILVFEGETSMQHFEHGESELPHRCRFGLVRTVEEPLRAGELRGTYKHTESQINCEGQTTKTFREMEHKRVSLP